MMQSNMLPGGRELAEEPGEAAMSGTIAPQDLLGPAIPQMTNDGSNDAQESMAEPELLALIIELRLRAGRGSSKERDKSSSLLSNGSRSASTSAVDTLDLCHRKIEKLPYEMVNIIKDDVVRLALGYNLITSLPSNFIDLARLRYLNVRANLMNTFPSVLCTLPSLEILDISRNKIRKLPSEPGRLLELKVLSMSNNRLRKLPVWLPRQRDLRILKLEGNPISWPPTHVSVMAPLDRAVVAEVEEKESDKEAGQLARKKAEERQMSLYISKLKAWIEENKDKIKGDQEESRLPARSPEEELRAAAEMDESAVGDPVLTALSPKTSPAQSRKTVEAEGSKASSIEPQTPGDSLRSIGAAFLNSRNEIQIDKARSKSDEIIGLPAKPHSGSRIHIQSPLRVANRVLDDLVEERRGSAELKQASPEQMDEAIGLVRSSSGLTTSMALQEITQSVERPPRDSARMPHMLLHHTRNNSLSTVQASSSQLATSASGSDTAIRRGIVRNKKSLPDLRQNAGIFASERSDNGDAGPAPASETAQRRKGSNASLERRPPLPKTSSENAAFATRSNGSVGTDIWLSNASNTRVVLPSEIDLVGSVGLNGGMQMGSVEAEAVEVERNSYFKRLSTLPASTISKSISVPVLQCVDATRGILYALSQMHSALKQYITFASDERTTSQLSRALDIASRSMGRLINSLDRFDSLSRIKGGSLDPHIVQGVLTSCSESVITFRKIVSLLLLQLKSLQDGADIRYTRTLLLLLFGSLAEIHHSWMVMEPLFKDVLPYLQGQSGINNFSLASSATVPSLSAGGPYTLPSIAEATSPISANNNGRLGTASTRPLRRRHAGSFSANDVAQGASMIPNVPLPVHGYEEIRKAQRPAALGPFPAPSRMGMYQVQQGDTDGGDLLDSNQLTPMAPLTPKESSRRIPEETSRRTLSNTSGGNMSAMSHIPGFHRAYPSDALEAAVDDHLVLLLVKITSIAYSVWASINDHLNSLGIPAASKGTNNVSALMKTHQATPENTPFMGDQSFAASPHTPARALRVEGSSSSVTVMQDQQEEDLSPENSTVPLPPQAAQSSSIMNKLRHLRESINIIIDQTNKLESCCDKVQERSGIKSPTMINISIGSNSDPTFHSIFMESSSFIKAVISISHYIKGLSNEHQFPKSIKVNLAQLTTCARDLTLHLHFLGGSSASSKAAAAVAVSPKQQRLAVK